MGERLIGKNSHQAEGEIPELSIKRFRQSPCRLFLESFANRTATYPSEHFKCRASLEGTGQ